MVTSNNDGKTENCSGSTVNMVISRITMPMVMLRVSRISRTPGLSGTIISRTILIINPEMTKSLLLFK
ncbi:MAG: hypothetical protein BWY65_01346 [Firmicutes bacterium ADurb.Bin373]|nr:MAG: hypothetical protein BWY65_01346 [Firmicutes bacterium ADurb.Bin373]